MSRPGHRPNGRRTQRAITRTDIDWDTAALPADAFDIALFHLAIEGFLFDRLTTSINPDTTVDAFVAGLVGIA